MASKHTGFSKLQKIQYNGHGLFEYLTNFNEFLARSKWLQLNGYDSTRVGDYFEVLVEGVLHTHPEFLAKTVYQVGYVPPHIVKKYNLPRDKKTGLDGAYIDQTGQLIPYQVKNYGADSLRYGDVSPFLGVTERLTKSRLIFTTTDRMNHKITDRDGVQGVLAGFFQNMPREEWENACAWILGQPQRIRVLKRDDLTPEQIKAIDDVVAELDDNDRTQYSMPPGTGKGAINTFLGTDILDRVIRKKSRKPQSKTKTLLYCVPSLLLQTQTYRILKRTYRDQICVKVVGSDSNAEPDQDIDGNFIVEPWEVTFPVNTTVEAVDEFRKYKTNKIKVIISTYDSVHKVGASYLKAKQWIDVALCDEAHNTISGIRSDVLYDTIVPIRKRVFMTATRKIITVRSAASAKAGLKRGMRVTKRVSMDDESLYGKLAYSMNPARAIELGLNVPIEMLVFAITDLYINHELVKDTAVISRKAQVPAHHYLTQMSIRLLLSKKSLGINKMILYVKSQKEAEELAGDGPLGIRHFAPKDYEICYVHGNMDSATREGMMDTFRNAKKAIIINPRCLSEGIDIPEVNAVYTVGPRQSNTDIVQILGRAQRNHYNEVTKTKKTKGYAVCMVYVEKSKGETLDDAIIRSKNGKFLETAAALAQDDADFATYLNDERIAIGSGIKGMRGQRSLATGVRVFGYGLNQKAAKASIELSMVKRLTSSWYEMFGQLLQFWKKNGKDTYPQITSNDDREVKLARWVGQQRIEANMTEERRRKLNQVGFVWEVREANFDKGLRLSIKHGRVPDAFVSKCGFPLGVWQRARTVDYKKKRLSDEKVQKLESITGWIWDMQSHITKQALLRGISMSRKYGRVSQGVKKEGFYIGDWQGRISGLYKDGKLDQKTIAELESVDGWSWDTRQERIIKGLELSQKYGMVKVEFISPCGFTLGSWQSTRRAEYRRGVLDKRLAKQLSECSGWEWNPTKALKKNVLDELFDKSLTVVAKFYRKHSRQPSYKEDGGIWLHAQKTYKRKGLLSKERERKIIAELGKNWLKGNKPGIKLA